MVVFLVPCRCAGVGIVWCVLLGVVLGGMGCTVCCLLVAVMDRKNSCCCTVLVVGLVAKIVGVGTLGSGPMLVCIWISVCVSACESFESFDVCCDFVLGAKLD